MTDIGEPIPVAAGIVSFHPDAALLLDLVAVLSRDVGRIYLFNNAPPRAGAGDGAGRLSDNSSPSTAGSNLGVGVGLNFIALAASRDGFERLALFDQDSRRVARHAAAGLGEAFDHLEALRRATRRASAPAAGGAPRPRRRARRSRRAIKAHRGAWPPTAPSRRSTSCRPPARCSTCGRCARRACSAPTTSSTPSTSNGASAPGRAGFSCWLGVGRADGAHGRHRHDPARLRPHHAEPAPVPHGDLSAQHASTTSASATCRSAGS